jgi:hypothetical protein
MRHAADAPPPPETSSLSSLVAAVKAEIGHIPKPSFGPCAIEEGKIWLMVAGIAAACTAVVVAVAALEVATAGAATIAAAGVLVAGIIGLITALKSWLEALKDLNTCYSQHPNDYGDTNLNRLIDQLNSWLDQLDKKKQEIQKWISDHT